MPKFYDYETQQEVSAQEAQALYQQGRLAIQPDASPTYVVDAQGQRYSTGDADELSNLLSQGFSLESQEETAQRNAIMEARNSPVQAGAEALAQGATLGLYGAAAGQLDRDYAEGMLLRRQEFGPGYGALEVAGAVAPALVTGGGFTPAGALARASQGAGTALQSTLAARGVGQGAARILGLAAEGALDGAVSGAAAQLSEDSLGGTEISAERLAASGALGALFGVGAGAAVGGLGVGAGKLGKGVAGRVRARAADAAVADPLQRAASDAGYMRFVPDRIQESWADLAETSGRATRDETLDVLNDANVRSEWLRSGAVKDDLNKRLRDSVQKVYDNDLHLRSAGAGEIHAKNLEGLLPNSPRDAFKAQAEANALIGGMKEQLESEGVLDLLGKKKFSRLARDVAFFEKKINDAFASRDMARGNVEIANLKRAMWRHSENAAKSRPSSGFDRQGEEWIKRFGLEQSEKTRLFLEREDVFGQAARNQRNRNEAWTRAIESGRKFNDLMSFDSGLKADGTDEWWLTKRMLDAEKVAKRINNIDNPNAEFENMIIQRHFQDLDDAYTAFKANGEIPDHQMKQFDEAHQAIRDAREVFNEASEKVKKFNILDTIEQSDRERSQLVQKVMSPGTLGIVGGFAGGGIGGIAGAAIGTALSAATSPGAMVREVTKLEAIGRRINGVKNSTQRKTEKAVRRLAMPKDARRKLQSNAVRAATRYFGFSQAEQKSAAERVEKRLTEFKAEATRLSEAVRYQADGMGSTAPKLTLAYAQVANRAAEFLQSKLPAPSTAPHRLQPKLNKTNWTAQDLDKFSKYMAAIQDPESVIEDLEAGRVSPESVEAIKAVYPTLFGEMQQTALAEISKQGSEMPFDSVIQLSLLLDIEGHPLLNPQMQQTMGEIVEQTKQKQQESSAPPNPGQTMKVDPTYMQRIQSL